MRVSIKDLAVRMDLGNNGVEFEVKDNDGNHLGDMIVARGGVTWCEGRTRAENGVRVTWNEFIDWMNSD
jgi:hypothetical protein